MSIDIDKKLKGKLEKKGYLMLPLDSLDAPAKETMYKLSPQGDVIVMCLPQDKYSASLWVKKGYVKDPEELKACRVDKTEGIAPRQFVCPICSETFSDQRKYAGHQNKHRWEDKNANKA